MLITLSLHSYLSSWALEVKFMKIGSKMLKICAFLLGALWLACGFMLGIVGAGPDGPHDSMYIRIFGFYLLALGATYIYSNE